MEWWAISLQVSHWTQQQQHISGHLKNPKCQLERAQGSNNHPTRCLVLELTRNWEIKSGLNKKKKKKMFWSSCQQVLDVVSAAWRLDCALLQHRRQTAGHATDSSTSEPSTVGEIISHCSTHQTSYSRIIRPLHPETIHKWSSYLSFPVLLLGFLRKDWFGPERVDMERGEAREKVDGGVLGIFFPRWPIHFFCSSWVRASRSMSRAEVTS